MRQAVHMPVCGTSAPLYATQISQVSVIPVTVAVITGPAVVSIRDCMLIYWLSLKMELRTELSLNTGRLTVPRVKLTTFRSLSRQRILYTIWNLSSPVVLRMVQTVVCYNQAPKHPKNHRVLMGKAFREELPQVPWTFRVQENLFRFSFKGFWDIL